VCGLCAYFLAGAVLLPGKLGNFITRGTRTRLARVSPDRDPETEGENISTGPFAARSAKQKPI
jgi:hypothetical protein